MLTVDRLNVLLQGSHILRDVSLAVRGGELTCLVGRNGAGKTTTLRTIMGYHSLASGAIELNGRRLDGFRTHAIAGLGVGYSPEESGVFGSLTVAENIEMATWTRPSGRPPADRIAQAYALFPGLRRHASRGGTQLSGGERKMLSIARALALDPSLLLLDEPFEGLSPAIAPAIGEGVATLARLGLGVLLAESNLHHVPDCASRLYVIERGAIVFSGTMAEARRDRGVVRIVGTG
jgi:branched-chain amino acid transport system ATP-binding protein